MNSSPLTGTVLASDIQMWEERNCTTLLSLEKVNTDIKIGSQKTNKQKG